MEPVRITLRLPADVHEQLTESAEATNRSMNAEIVYRLKQSLGMDEVADLANRAEHMGTRADTIGSTIEKLQTMLHSFEATIRALEDERDYHRKQQSNHEDLVANKLHK